MTAGIGSGRLGGKRQPAERLTLSILTRILDVECNERLQVDDRDASQE